MVIRNSGRAVYAAFAWTILGALLLTHVLFSEDPSPHRDPQVGEAGDFIVAVLDSGVDAAHQDLNGSVLRGWNVIDGGEDTSDKIGHGTLVAGLIAGKGDGTERVRGLAPGVKILPVKVVTEKTNSAIGPTVAAGLAYAMKQGARIVCIPLGGPRGSGSLEELLDEAEKKGVLVIAAAGIASGTQDYWPAGHPWVVSCTAASESVVTEKDGTPRKIMTVSSRANLTGKTEVAGDPSAVSCLPGDHYGPLEGTSAVAARAAGIAAKIWSEQPGLTAAEVRRILVESGPRMGTPNFHNVYPTHLLDAEAAGRCADAGLADLAVRNAVLRPWPWHPGEKRAGEAEIVNCGRTQAGGTLVIDIDKPYKFEIPPLAPGEKKVVAFEIPAEADLSGGRARVSLDAVPKETNTANNALLISVAETKRERPSVIFGTAGVERLDVVPGKAKAFAVLRNLETADELPVDVRFHIGDTRWTRALRLKPGEEARVDADWDVPSEGKAVVLECEVEVKGTVTDKVRVGICIENRLLELQYADVWDRNEIIFDMPWAIVEGRTEIPLLVFVPETKNWGMAVDGIVLTDIKVWRSSVATIFQFAPEADWWGEGQKPIYGASTSSSFSSVPPTLPGGISGVWEKFMDIPVESETGDLLNHDDKQIMRPAGVLGHILHPSWHRIIRLPLADPAPTMYFTARATSTNWRFRPPENWALPLIDATEVTIKTMRVQMRKAMPKLSDDGHYFDTHVHTAAEYSTEIVDPRLAWGGPPRMVIWTAYSLGMIDSHEPGAALDKVITTDHNCFLTDTDVPQFPPFQKSRPQDEFLTLREYFGMRSCGQEVSLYRAASPAYTAHALLYEHPHALKGPWFGDRSDLTALFEWGDRLVDALFLLREIMKKEKLPGVLDFARLADWVWKKVDKDPVWGEVADLVARHSGKQESVEKVRQSLQLAAALTEPQLQRLHDEIQKMMDNAKKASIPNDNKVQQVLEWTKKTQGRLFAAHPRSGGYSWTDEEIGDADNMGPKTGSRWWTKGEEFSFSGFQIWNDPKQHQAYLGASQELFTLNPMGRWFMNREWHHDLCDGLKLFARETRKGLQYRFTDGDPDTFIRKLYISAGSDAHGDFNYGTGVTASVMSHHAIEPWARLFSKTGSGAEAFDAAYAKCRTYVLGGTQDDLYHGRSTLTDGPLVGFTMDSDLKFDVKSLEWHDLWTKEDLARDDDGQVGGAGTFDGGRTMLVRKGCRDVIARVSVATDATWSGELTKLGAWWWDESKEAAMAPDEHKVEIPAFAQELAPLKKPGNARLSLVPQETGCAMLFGFASKFGPWHPEGGVAMTNPVWYTPMGIEPEVHRVEYDGGRPQIPKEKFWVTYRSDISMKKRKNAIWIQQLSPTGDSTGPRIALVHQEAEGWTDVKGPDGKTLVLRSGMASATNEKPIPLGEPWYPKEGIVTFVVVLEDPEDAHGNRLNPVAAVVEVPIPAPTGPQPDGGSTPDPGGNASPKPADTGGKKTGSTTESRPPDSALCSVQKGDVVQLPKGATLDGEPIPAGSWTVPEIPEKGLSLVVSCSGYVLTTLLTASPAKNEPWIERGPRGFYGSAPAPGQGPAKVTLKNFSKKTIEFPDPILVTPTTCVFSAPEAEPGACDITVAQGDAVRTVPLEAVAAKIAWDCPDAQIGDVRELRVVLEGASRPADWRIAGTVTVQSGQIESVIDPKSVLREGNALTLTALPGDAAYVARVRAIEAGSMIAHAKLRATK